MKTRQKSKPKKKDQSKGKQKAKSPESKAQSATDRMIYIRVLYSDVYNTLNTDLCPSAPRHLYLIEGTLDDIARYAGDTIDWIIRVSDLICDPSGKGHIYTHTEGTPSYWYDKDRDADWLQVVLGDPLLAGIYEFVATDPITLSQICQRQTHSVTSRGSTTTSSRFQCKYFSPRYRITLWYMCGDQKSRFARRISSRPETCRRWRGWSNYGKICRRGRSQAVFLEV